MASESDAKKQKEKEFENCLSDDDVAITPAERKRIEEIIEDEEAKKADPPDSLYQIIKEIAEEEGKPLY